jgi:hypothetical protein
MATKKTGDPITDLPFTSRRFLESAPPAGRYQIPYSVGRIFFLRGWGDHQGKNNTRTGRGIPTTLFQLNTEGLKAADTARRRSWSDLDRTTYDAVHSATLSEINALLEDYSMDALIRNATELIERVQVAGKSTAGARGYLDALVQYRDAQASVTA